MRKLSIFAFMLCICWTPSFAFPAQRTGTQSLAVASRDVLTNADVVRMHRAQLSTDVICARIAASQNQFDVSPEELERLKQEGISDLILLTMVQSQGWTIRGGNRVEPDPSRMPSVAKSVAQRAVQIAPGTAPVATPMPAQPMAQGETTTARDRTGKPRIFVIESNSWESSGSSIQPLAALAAAPFVGTYPGAFLGYAALTGPGGGGGARPQTAEIIRTFNDRCPAVIVTSRPEKADYVVRLEHEGGKNPTYRDNKVVLFNHDGDAIFSRSTVILGNSVKDACNAIKKGWVKPTQPTDSH